MTSRRFSKVITSNFLKSFEEKRQKSREQVQEKKRSEQTTVKNSALASRRTSVNEIIMAQDEDLPADPTIEDRMRILRDREAQ
jgi:hypothetical protein